MASDLRQARIATTAIFVVTGAVSASWAVRIPTVQERLGLSPGELGLAVLALEGGAIVGLPAGGALVGRLGSRRGIVLGFALYAPGLLAVATAPSLAWLAAALAAMAAANSVVDVAMTVQGIELERRYGRPLLSGLGAGHAFGALAAGLVGTAAAAAGGPLAAHFALVAAVTLLVALTSARGLVREEIRSDRPLVARPTRPLLLLGLVAFCAFLVEGTAASWSAVHLASGHEAGPAWAAAAFTAFSLALAVGRLGADRLVSRLGRAGLVRGAGAGVAVAAVGLILAPTTPLAVSAWALLGASLAGIAPALLGAAPAVHDRASAPVAVAAVTTLGYLGSFTGPPATGALAEVAGVTPALGLLPVAGAAIALLARRALRPHARGADGRARTHSEYVEPRARVTTGSAAKP